MLNWTSGVPNYVLRYLTGVAPPPYFFSKVCMSSSSLTTSAVTVVVVVVCTCTFRITLVVVVVVVVVVLTCRPLLWDGVVRILDSGTLVAACGARNGLECKFWVDMLSWRFIWEPGYANCYTSIFGGVWLNGSSEKALMKWLMAWFGFATGVASVIESW